MPFAFQRRDSSPRTPDYLSRSSSPGRSQPLWKQKSRGMLDIRRIIQIIGVVVVVVVFIALLQGFSPAGNGDDDKYAPEKSPTYNHFVDFEGGLDCRVSSQDLYISPLMTEPLASSRKQGSPFCQSRKSLLAALSGGGRFGFNQPYTPLGCHYKWYSTTEICMILDRFDGLVFVGDDLIGGIYAAFNMLLRRNVALGGLEQWRMSDKEMDACRCSAQYTNGECSKYFVTSSANVAEHDIDGGPRSPYACNRLPHFYYPISGVATPSQTQQFEELLAQDLHSWRPVPIVHSLGLSISNNWQVATESMDEWLTVADASGRNTPFLWIGPNAAGHLKPPSKIMQEGNNALWHYSLMMQREAERRGVESIEMYNATLQASSYDGSGYDERVSLVQAMMVINWLARLETT